jgi:hypothetical protein
MVHGLNPNANRIHLQPPQVCDDVAAHNALFDGAFQEVDPGQLRLQTSESIKLHYKLIFIEFCRIWLSLMFGDNMDSNQTMRMPVAKHPSKLSVLHLTYGDLRYVLFLSF